ncbi:MAG: hypothetical protein C5S38_02480 [Candidatus Methanophagaceae archaeon]|nr:MAG: hypothetical protein C5S38_02480 [Methanophagales archaeon]
MDIGSAAFQSFRSVIGSIHSGHACQQCLGCTNVGGGTFPFDVLFPGLQGHPEGRFFIHINGDSDDPARYMPFVLLPGCKECSMRTPVEHGDSETLGRSHHHISSPFAGRSDQYQAHDIGSHSHSYLLFMGCLSKYGIVPDFAIGSRILDERSKHGAIQCGILVRSKLQLNAQGFGPVDQYSFGLRKDILIHKEPVPALFHRCSGPRIE